MSNQNPPELLPGSIPATPLATTATAANSTTLAQLAAAARRAKLVVGVLTTLAGVALVATAAAPWNYVAAVVFQLAAVVVAWRTLTPEQVDALLAQLGDAGKLAATELSKKKDGAP